MRFVYSFAYDREAACLVSVFSGPSSTDEDYERLVRSGDQLREDSAERQGVSTWIVVVDPSHGRPSDLQRRRLAAARGTAPKNLAMHIAVVTESALIRGAMRAIEWLSPPAPNYVLHAARSFEHAMLWCEQRRGQLLPSLRRLLAEARAAATAASGA